MQPDEKADGPLAGFMKDKRGILDLGRPMAIVGTVIGAVVVVLLIAALVATFFGAIADVNENLSDENVTTGDATADVILRVFPIVIGVVAVIGFVGLIIAALQFTNGNGGMGRR